MIEGHVVSEPIAKQLKAAGFPQETVFCWHRIAAEDPEETDFYALRLRKDSRESSAAAPLLSEVLEQLPDYAAIGNALCALTIKKRRTTGFLFADEFRNSPQFADPNPANAAALLWLWWKEQQ